MQKRVEYSEAIKTKFPEAVAYAIAKDENEIANPITLGWIMCTSHQPPMLAISVAFQRYSYETIRRSNCFTVVFPNEAQLKEALFFGTHSGKDMDKLKEFGTATSPATRRQPARIPFRTSRDALESRTPTIRSARTASSRG